MKRGLGLSTLLDFLNPSHVCCTCTSMLNQKNRHVKEITVINKFIIIVFSGTSSTSSMQLFLVNVNVNVSSFVVVKQVHFCKIRFSSSHFVNINKSCVDFIYYSLSSHLKYYHNADNMISVYQAIRLKHNLSTYNNTNNIAYTTGRCLYTTA